MRRGVVVHLLPLFLVFPSFSEGLSLRHFANFAQGTGDSFPFLFGGTFIEALLGCCCGPVLGRFPFLFGGTFIEALLAALTRAFLI